MVLEIIQRQVYSICRGNVDRQAQLLTLTAPEMTTLLEVCVFLIQTLDRPITEFS
jgi:catalase (peroxidase I)